MGPLVKMRLCAFETTSARVPKINVQLYITNVMKTVKIDLDYQLAASSVTSIKFICIDWKPTTSDLPKMGG